MLTKISNLLKEGGFDKWNGFHDATLYEVSLTSKTIVMLIKDIYDWKLRCYTDTQVVLVLSSSAGQDVFTPGHDLYMIYRLEIDDQKNTISCLFSEAQFTIDVDFEESFLVEV